ncbi:MAG: PAS domain S-box protein [Spirochaetes bacterium]|nr:PAS domain S-box protein [Spirochaetota bacterium]
MTEWLRTRYKPVVIAFLLLVSLSLMLYFYGYLHVGTVFIHFFYIPIILSSLWWGLRGIWVSVFLSVSILLMHIFLRRYFQTPDDFFRAFMFVLISIVVGGLSERFARTRERMSHLNLVLRSIRDINHLMTKEKDRDRLLKGICATLVENRSYFYAWIALVDENSRLVASGEAGLGDAFFLMTDMLTNGTLPLCVHRSLYQRHAILTKDPGLECAGCPLKAQYADKGRMTIIIHPGGKLRGILSVSIPEDVIADPEERVLFEEIANDIEYALGGIELRGDHQLALDELKESEERFRSIIENAPFGYYRIDRDGRYEYVNPQWERMFGLAAGDFIGKRVVVPASGLDEQDAGSLAGRVLAGETVRGEFGAHRKEGTMTFQTYYCHPLYHHGEITGAEGFLNDITERKNAELALHKSRRMLSQIVEGSPIPTFVIDENHRLTHWNRACEILTVRSAGKMIGTRRQWEAFYASERPTMADLIMDGTRDPSVLANYSHEYRKSTILAEAWESERFFPALGKRGRWLFLTAALLRDAEGNITGAVETLQDVTGRRRAEEEKIKAYTELEQIFNTTPVGMRVIDRNFNTIHINRRFMEMFDLDSSHFSRDGRRAWDREIAKADRVLMKRILGGAKYLEYEIRTRIMDDDAVFIVHASPYFSNDGTVIGVIENFTSITEMRNLQNGIMRVAEVERQRIGQDLHDGLGQNLTAVSFLVEALKEKSAARPGAVKGEIEKIESMVRDAIVQTRSLSRMLSPVEMEKNGLRSALDEMAASTEKIFKVTCRISQEGNFFIDDNQAATHLFYIAREAVTNSIKHGKARHIDISLAAAGGGLRMAIRDDGSGAVEGKKSVGLGLRIMRYRAGIIGADFSAGNRDGGGFEVSVLINA